MLGDTGWFLSRRKEKVTVSLAGKLNVVTKLLTNPFL